MGGPLGNTTAAKGWENLCQQAPGNTCDAWEQMRTNRTPRPPTPRHHQLKGALAFAEHGGKQLACWQIEVTGGGRIWYLLDPDRRTVWVTEAGTDTRRKPTKTKSLKTERVAARARTSWRRTTPPELTTRS